MANKLRMGYVPEEPHLYVERVCSHVVILHRGKIVAGDSIERLRTLMSLPTLRRPAAASRGTP